MRKNSSGSARIPVPPPPALHRRADHHPAHHRPHVVQLAIHHDISIWADDVAALADLPVHRTVETFEDVHPEPYCIFLPSIDDNLLCVSQKHSPGASWAFPELPSAADHECIPQIDSHQSICSWCEPCQGMEAPKVEQKASPPPPPCSPRSWGPSQCR